jgi:hypothetical protein
MYVGSYQVATSCYVCWLLPGSYLVATNRCKNKVREDGRTIGGEEWQENVYNREEWKKVLRTARIHHVLNTLRE